MLHVFSVNASAPCPRTLVQVKKKLDGVMGEIRKREREAHRYIKTSSGRGDVAVTGHEELDEAVSIFIYIQWRSLAYSSTHVRKIEN